MSLRLDCIAGSTPQEPAKRISLCQEKPFTSHLSSYWSRANGHLATHQSPVLTFRLLWPLLNCTCYARQSLHTSVLAFCNPTSSLNSQTIPVFRLISPPVSLFQRDSPVCSAFLCLCFGYSVPERGSWLLWLFSLSQIQGSFPIYRVVRSVISPHPCFYRSS